MDDRRTLPAYDAIYIKLQEVDTLYNQFNLSSKYYPLQPLPQELTEVKDRLPFLNAECDDLIVYCHQLQENINSTKLSLTAYQRALEGWRQRLLLADAKIDVEQKAQQELAEERQQLITIWKRNRFSLTKHASLELLKIQSKHPDDLGMGLNLFEHENLPKIEEQANSLEKNILHLKDKIANLKMEKTKVHQEVLSNVEAATKDLINIKIIARNMDKACKELVYDVTLLKQLKQISQEKSLFGAAVRGDIEQIKLLLLTESPNTVNKFGRKPLYYACRCGHDIALQLLDVTTLNNQELDDIIADLPTRNKATYQRFYAALKCGKNLYDYLWQEHQILGKNIIRILKDYISPESLSAFGFLSDSFKRSLSLNWDRKHIAIAQDMLDVFQKIPSKLLQDEKFCQSLINDYWDDFFAKNPDANDTFARRLHYLKNKLEPQLGNALTETSLSNSTEICPQHKLEAQSSARKHSRFGLPFNFNWQIRKDNDENTATNTNSMSVNKNSLRG